MTPTPTPMQFQNATSSFASTVGLFNAVVFLATIAVVLVISIQVLPVIAEFRIIENIFGSLITSFVYALRGALTVVVIGLVASPVYYMLTIDPSTRSAVGKWIGIGLGIYVALVGIGWLSEKASSVYFSAHPKANSLSDILQKSDEKEEDYTSEPSD